MDLPNETVIPLFAAADADRPWTSFVGREAELAELKPMLFESRLLTLIGSEGIGKSRLAARLGSELRGSFPGGVWFVELPSIADTDLVACAVARALGVQASPQIPVKQALAAFLRDRQALVLLDVDEENRASCARLVTALVGYCPELRIVVCSRKGLGLRDEAIYCVPALATFDLAGRWEAERLCRERAAGLPVPLDLGEERLVELCSLLDGLPLALEIAIGGLASHPQDSLSTVTRSLYDLTGGLQLSREQILQQGLVWGWRRLSEPEQLLLERLSVFHSGWSPEAVSAVCCDESLSSDLLPALLESLYAGAFVAREERAGFTRELLREAVRSYAESRLALRGELETFRRRHAEYYLQLAEMGAPGLTGPDREAWKAYLDRDYINFRAALLCLHQDAGDAGEEIRLASALLPLLEACGRSAEGHALVKRAREANRTPVVPAEDYPTARARCFDRIDRCRVEGDRKTRVQHLSSLARLALSHSDFATAISCYEQNLEVVRSLGDRAQEARALHCLGSAARDGGEYALAREHYEQALKLNRTLRHRMDEAHNLNALARLALLQGNSKEAAKRFQEGLDLFRELGERAWEAHNRGQILRLSLPNEPLWERTPEGV